MRRLLASAIVLFFVVASVVGTSSIANAQSDGDGSAGSLGQESQAPRAADGSAIVNGWGTGGDVATEADLSVPLTAAQQREMARVLATYIGLQGPTDKDDAAMYAEADRLGIRAAVDAQVRSMQRQAMSPAATPPLSLLVNITQEPQIKSYYRGPTVGSEVVKSSKFWSPRSAKDGLAISQTAMANANHMRTDINGTTAWASRNFVTGLNAWLGSSYYEQINRPNGESFKAAVVANMLQALPPTVNAVEIVDQAHYNNHPNRTIGHWMVIDFYTDYGNTSRFVDSTAGSGIPGYGNAAPRFTYPTAWFAATFLAPNGNGMAI